jgi:hypothetical protein
MSMIPARCRLTSWWSASKGLESVLEAATHTHGAHVSGRKAKSAHSDEHPNAAPHPPATKHRPASMAIEYVLEYTCTMDGKGVAYTTGSTSCMCDKTFIVRQRYHW